MKVKEFREAINDPDIKEEEEVLIFILGKDGIDEYALPVESVNTDEDPIMIFTRREVAK